MGSAMTWGVAADTQIDDDVLATADTTSSKGERS